METLGVQPKINLVHILLEITFTFFILMLGCTINLSLNWVILLTNDTVILF